MGRHLSKKINIVWFYFPEISASHFEQNTTAAKNVSEPSIGSFYIDLILYHREGQKHVVFTNSSTKKYSVREDLMLL